MSSPSLFIHGNPIDNRPLPNTLLYHYTTAGGLAGILKNKKLWATDLSFLNDHSEYDFGLQRAREIVREFLNALPSATRSTPQPALPGDISLDGLREIVFEAQDQFRSKYVFCVACLCEDGDLLSQWRGYASPGGYSIGFDAPALRACLTDETYRIVPVIYDHSKDSAIASQLDDWIGQLGSPSWQADPTLSTASLHILLSGCAMQLKNPAFREENEWRVADLQIIDPSSKILFREGGLGLVPFIEVPLDRNGIPPVKRIYVGPGSDFELRKQALQVLLTSNGYDVMTIEIISSAIPFRAV